MADKLMLGVARADITPKVGCNLMGYSPDVISNAINDNLTVTSFVFSYGDTKAAMISATVLVIDEEDCDYLRKEINKLIGIPFENILISAIHTHSGPITARMPGWGEYNKEYCENIFFPCLLEATKEANDNMVAVEMGIGSGKSYVGINRRQFNEKNEIVLGQCEWGPFNPEMTVLAFRDENNTPVANMIHYGCHATGAGSNLEISRDWPGVMIDRVEAVTGAITAFFNGPEGDVGPRLTNGRTTGYKDIEYAMEIGAVAAQDAIEIYKTIKSYTSPELSCAERKLQVKLASRLPEDLVREKLKDFEGKEVANHHAQEKDYYERIIKSYEEGYKEKEFIEIPQVAIKIGDVAFVGFAYELFSEIGMRINKMSSIGSVLSLSCTNGTTGYFPTESQLPLGGYEVKMFKTRNLQPYAKNADFNLITETLKNLEQL